ncbi:MAG: DUF1484 family protein [Pseudomonadota bacterium]|nr:DUF1484 family protein [Pseudomonadota bacterium]
MKNFKQSPLDQRLEHVSSQDRRSVARKVYATINPLSALVDQLGNQPEIQAQFRELLTVLSTNASALLRVGEAVDSELTDVELGFEAFIAMLDQMEEQHIHTGRTYCLLAPLYRQLNRATNAVNEAFN